MEALKQPQLGKTIQALRQEKKLTQEELVEKCNVNVRTLQRIEAGEVSPRSFTIRAILEALDYKFEQVASSIERKTSIRRMNIGWIAGLIYFVFGFAEYAADYYRFELDMPVYFPFIYIVVKAVLLTAYVFFLLGFVEAGKSFNVSILKISAFLMMGSMAVIELYDIISIFSALSMEDFMLIKGVEAVAFGGADIVFGIALLRLAKQLGTSATLAGILEIMIGVCFITFFLSFLGLMFTIPAIILEIIVLFKCYELAQGKE